MERREASETPKWRGEGPARGRGEPDWGRGREKEREGLVLRNIFWKKGREREGKVNSQGRRVLFGKVKEVTGERA